MAGSYEATLRWRLKNPDKRNEQKKRNYRQTQGQQRTRRVWTEEEERQILATPRETDATLAKRIGRSVQAIQLRRSKLLKTVRVTVTDSS